MSKRQADSPKGPIDTTSTTFDDEMRKSLRRLEELYAAAQAKGDLRGAAQIEGQRAELLARLQAPVASAGTAELLPLHQVAELLCVKPRTLQLWCASEDTAHRPAMPHEKKGRRILLDPSTASNHLERHGTRLKGFVPYRSRLSAPTAAEVKTTDMPLPRDLVDVLHTLITDPTLISQIGSDRIRALAQIETLVLRRQEYETRRARLIPAEDVLGMLRSLAEVFRDEVDQGGAARTARAVLSWMRSAGLRPPEHPETFATLENLIREQANATLDAIGARLQEQSQSVQMLGESC